MQKITTRKLGSMSEDQLETLEYLLGFLKSLSVISEYHILSRSFHDTVTTYHRASSALSVNSQWCSLYDVEGIIIVDGSHN